MKIITVSSGKGGVGKTTLSCHLALALANENKKILMLDADLGLANVDIHFGVHPQYHLGDVFKGRPLRESITPVLKNLDLIAGGSGLVELTQLNAFQRREMINQVQDLQFSYDYAVIDTSSGIYEHVLHLSAVADECIVVLTSDPSSFADAYALIKVLNQKYKLQNFKIICNQVTDEKGAGLFIKFSEVVERFLSVRLSLLGCLPFDENIQKNQQLQRLTLRQNQNKNFESKTCKALKQMATELMLETNDDSYAGSLGQKASGLEAIFRPASGHA